MLHRINMWSLNATGPSDTIKMKCWNLSPRVKKRKTKKESKKPDTESVKSFQLLDIFPYSVGLSQSSPQSQPSPQAGAHGIVLLWKCWSRTHNGGRLSSAATLLRRSGRLWKQAQQVPGLRPVPGKHPVTISLERHAERLSCYVPDQGWCRGGVALWCLHWKDE